MALPGATVEGGELALLRGRRGRQADVESARLMKESAESLNTPAAMQVRVRASPAPTYRAHVPLRLGEDGAR